MDMKVILCTKCNSRDIESDLHTLEFADNCTDDVECWFTCNKCGESFLAFFEPKQKKDTSYVEYLNSKV